MKSLTSSDISILGRVPIN